MRNLISLLFTFVLLSFSIIAMASTATIIPKSNGYYSVELKGETKTSINVEVKAIDGAVLDQFTGNSRELSAHIFSSESLIRGKYNIIVTHDRVTHVLPFAIENQNLKFDRFASKTIHNPVIRNQKDYLDIDILLLGKFSTELKLIDEEGREYYFDSKWRNGVIQKRMNIEQLSSGTYYLTIRVSDGPVNKLFTELIIIE